MQWRKPSSCNADSPMCLEVTGAGEAVLLRATEQPDEVIAVTRPEFGAWVAAAKAGEYDDLT
jgi:hypothetical protein